MVTGSQISAYLLGRDKNPVAEFDISLDAGQTLSRAQLHTAIKNAGSSGSFAYLTMQSQLQGAENEFVGKFSLAPNYNLSVGEGRKITPLSELVLLPNESEYLKFESLEDGLNLHFTVFA